WVWQADFSNPSSGVSPLLLISSSGAAVFISSSSSHALPPHLPRSASLPGPACSRLGCTCKCLFQMNLRLERTFLVVVCIGPPNSNKRRMAGGVRQNVLEICCLNLTFWSFEPDPNTPEGPVGEAEPQERPWPRQAASKRPMIPFPGLGFSSLIGP
ncbi:hypothetical protein D4764_16G0003680, partial [Takifugu flavidus]